MINGFCGKLDANGGLAFEIEFVFGEAAQELRLADTGVPDQHDLEQEVILLGVAGAIAHRIKSCHFNINIQ